MSYLKINYRSPQDSYIPQYPLRYNPEKSPGRVSMNTSTVKPQQNIMPEGTQRPKKADKSKREYQSSGSTRKPAENGIKSEILKCLWTGKPVEQIVAAVSLSRGISPARVEAVILTMYALE